MSPELREYLLDTHERCRPLAEATVRVADGRGSRMDRARAKTFLGWHTMGGEHSLLEQARLAEPAGLADELEALCTRLG